MGFSSVFYCPNFDPLPRHVGSSIQRLHLWRGIDSAGAHIPLPSKTKLALALSYMGDCGMFHGFVGKWFDCSVMLQPNVHQ